MRRKQTDSSVQVKGYYIEDVIRGFTGEHEEGKRMLKLMGLKSELIPFSVANFIRNGKTKWYDHDGHPATISFKFKPDQMECSGNYLGKKKSIRLFLEWGACDDLEMVSRLESETIGECCMKCIYENLI